MKNRTFNKGEALKSDVILVCSWKLILSIKDNDRPENTTLTRYETTVLGVMQQGSYSSMLMQGNNSRFLVHANGTGILLSRAESDDRRKEMNHGSDALGDLNLTEEMEFGVYDDI